MPIDVRDDEGRTPLYWAALEDHKALLEMLIEKGADVCAENEVGQTPLYASVQRNVDLEIIELLLKNGAGIKERWTPLHVAAAVGDKEAVESLLVEDGDRPELHAFDKNGFTPLFLAVVKGHGEVVEILSSRGANVNCRDVRGDSPLHYAAMSGNQELISLLLARGADVTCVTVERSIARGMAGQTALHWAALYGAAETVALLLDGGANIQACDNLGCTSLHYATERGSKEKVELLLERGGDITTVALVDGISTPLHIAAERGKVGRLLSSGEVSAQTFVEC